MLAASDGHGPRRLTKLLQMLPKTVVDGDDTLKRKVDAVTKSSQQSKDLDDLQPRARPASGAFNEQAVAKEQQLLAAAQAKADKLKKVEEKKAAAAKAKAAQKVRQSPTALATASANASACASSPASHKPSPSTVPLAAPHRRPRR